MSESRPIIIPRWMAASICTMIGTVILAAAGWAWQVNGDLREIKAQITAATKLRDNEIADVRRELARLERTCRP